MASLWPFTASKGLNWAALCLMVRGGCFFDTWWGRSIISAYGCFSLSMVLSLLLHQLYCILAFLLGLQLFDGLAGNEIIEGINKILPGYGYIVLSAEGLAHIVSFEAHQFALAIPLVIPKEKDIALVYQVKLTFQPALGICFDFQMGLFYWIQRFAVINTQRDIPQTDIAGVKPPAFAVPEFVTVGEGCIYLFLPCDDVVEVVVVDKIIIHFVKAIEKLYLAHGGLKISSPWAEQNHGKAPFWCI